MSRGAALIPLLVLHGAACLEVKPLRAPEQIEFFVVLELEAGEVARVGSLRSVSAPIVRGEASSTIIVGYSSKLREAFEGGQVPLGAQLALADDCDSALPQADWVLAPSGQRAAPRLTAPGLAPKCPSGECIDGACPGEVIDVAVGPEHACALVYGGDVYCFGNDRWGRAGQGTWHVLQEPTILPSVGDAVQLVAGRGHTCARTRDGRVYCWGLNEQLQLSASSGNYTWTPNLSLVEELNDAIDIAAGDDHSCAVRADGRVFCWGDNRRGQLGVPPDDQRFSAYVQDFSAVRVFAGGDRSCALSAQGEALCWGRDQAPLARFEPGVIDMAIGAQRWCALRQAGLECSSELPSAPSRPRFEEPLKAVFAGGEVQCAITQSEHAYCWGDNRLGQLLRPALIEDEEPVALFEDQKVTDIAIGSGSLCAIVQGALHCWGDSAHGALGAGARAILTRPEQLSVSASALSVSRTHACEVKDGEVFCWGRNDRGQLGRAPMAPTPFGERAQVPGLSEVVKLAVGDGFSCARTEAGVIYCFGDDRAGQLSLIGASGPLVRVPLPQPAIDLEAAPDFACALGENLQLYCWGGGAEIQAVSPRERFTSLQTSENWMCGLGPQGVACFNYGAGGLVGRDIDFSGLDVAQLDGGTEHHCALTAAGEVYCFGSNVQQQLGLPADTFRGDRVLLPIPPATALAAGGESTCAVLADSGLMCWGDNTYGALTESVEDISAQPVRIPNLSGVERIAARGRLICAQGSMGTRCWGLNNFGQANPYVVERELQARRVELP